MLDRLHLITAISRTFALISLATGVPCPHACRAAVRELRTESRSASRFAGRRVHFIGIGGCGMSGLARMLLDAARSSPAPSPSPTRRPSS